ncbi:MAG: glycosyltransferase, partial [Chloroflexi bacterium]
MTEQELQKHCIAAVIPCYRVEREIRSVLQTVPSYIRHIIVVDDASPDSTADLVTASAKNDERLILIRHPSNQGVGGAMVTGYRKALEIGAQIVVKIDGDGQMDMDHLPELLKALTEEPYCPCQRFFVARRALAPHTVPKRCPFGRMTCLFAIHDLCRSPHSRNQDVVNPFDLAQSLINDMRFCFGANDMHIGACIHRVADRDALHSPLAYTLHHFDGGWLPIMERRSGCHHDRVHHIRVKFNDGGKRVEIPLEDGAAAYLQPAWRVCDTRGLQRARLCNAMSFGRAGPLMRGA